MPVSSLSAAIKGLLPESYGSSLTPQNKTEHLGGFSDIYHDAIENTKATEFRNKETSLDLLTGLTDDLSGMMLDSEKASLALNLTIQIRNKVLDAYSEIMRMQV